MSYTCSVFTWCFYHAHINLALKEFMLQYNEHPMRTAHNLSPRQQFCLGVHALHSTGRIEIQDVLDPDCSYGVDEDGPIPQLQSEAPVVVDPPNIQLDPHQSVIVDYICNVQALTDDGNHGVTHYLQTLQLVESWRILWNSILLHTKYNLQQTL